MRTSLAVVMSNIELYTYPVTLPSTVRVEALLVDMIKTEVNRIKALCILVIIVGITWVDDRVIKINTIVHNYVPWSIAKRASIWDKVTMKCLEAVIFGNVIRTLRKERGLSQEKLAELSNLDMTYISMIERAVRVPTIRTLFHLARALEVPAGDIIAKVEKTLDEGLAR